MSPLIATSLTMSLMTSLTDVTVATTFGFHGDEQSANKAEQRSTVEAFSVSMESSQQVGRTEQYEGGWEFWDNADRDSVYVDENNSLWSAIFEVGELNDSSLFQFDNYTTTDVNDYADYDDWMVVLPRMVVTSIVVSGFIASIIVGNVLIVASVVLFREMRTLTNWTIVSLATADLLVAMVVLPFSLQYEMLGRWSLGRIFCDFWITTDVFCCTASILNIVAIAIDRYWLITRNMRYTHGTLFPRRYACKVMVGLAWTTSGVISVSPLLGWRTNVDVIDDYEEGGSEEEGSCQISQDYGYTIFSTFGAFWFPLAIILALYFRIFWIAQKRLQRRIRQTLTSKGTGPTRRLENEIRTPVEPLENTLHRRRGTEGCCLGNQKHRRSSHSSSARTRFAKDSPRPDEGNRETRVTYRKCQYRRMRNSARMLGLIIGGFVLCWLPFFLLATILPFCERCIVPQGVASVVTWLGYSNSLLNPVIYAIWDKNFRRCFNRITSCNFRRQQRPL